MILQIAVAAPLFQLFDYLPPAGWDNKPQAGLRFLVPFGRQKLIGVLVSSLAESTHKQPLKRAIRCLDNEPVLPEAVIALTKWASNYYQHPIGECFNVALPAWLRQLHDAELQPASRWHATRLGQLSELDLLKRAPKQQQALLILREHPGGLHNTTLRNLEVKPETLRALAKKELAECRIEEAKETHDAPVLARSPLTLNAQQQLAVDSINSTSGFKPWLLHGITGSGKTEVYLQLMERVISQGQQVLLLVPEIGLTPQTLHRVEQRFNRTIAHLHSGMTDKQRFQQWHKSANGQAAVIVGTRSAIFTPMPNLGMIIVDEEHDASFKQQEGFRYSARSLAMVRAQQQQIPIILGSGTPSLESLHNAQHGRYGLLQLTERAGDARPPQIELIDLKAEHLTNGLSTRLIQAIKQTLKKQQQVLVFLNRRGYSPVLLCHDCGWSAHCHQCDHKMTLHRGRRLLHCHHCDQRMTMPQACPSCQSSQLIPVGAGTERLEETLQALCPDVPVVRIDRDSTRRKGSLEKALQKINQGEPAILLGTQMLAKGHHFPQVTLAAIVDSDSGFLSTELRAAEHTGQLITQVAGRAGRGEHAGRLLIQTHLPEHPLLQTLVNQGYWAFCQKLLIERRENDWPPYTHLALFRAEAMQLQPALDCLAEFRQLSQQAIEHNQLATISLLGPAPSPQEKRAGRYRAQLLITAVDRKPLHQLISAINPQLRKSKLARKVRWHLDIDPVDLY